jgi:hypothetical protein
MPEGHATTQLAGIANLALQATVRSGFVEAFESVTFARRLEAVFGTLNGLRLASREAVMGSGPFPDAIGRFGIIQSFRYAIVPPKRPAGRTADALPPLLASGPHHLSLNVCFDGGWEPYLRVVYRDLGPLLDAIFCNCEGYPASASSSIDDYTKWVRAHEITGGIFYTESAISVGDQRYLVQVEKTLREAVDPQLADATIAGLALVDPDDAAQSALAQVQADPRAALQTGLRALRALHALRPLYPANAERDDRCLLRLAHHALREFHQLVDGGIFDSAALPAPLQALKQQYACELAWFRGSSRAVPVTLRSLTFEPAAVQAGILRGDRGITHGCLVLFHVNNAQRARACLSQPALASPEGSPGNERQCCNLAFTYRGLLALGFEAATLADWPQEFIDGMEARAGLLGDLHANHPDRWQRPLRNWPAAAAGAASRRIELSSVHGVIQFRIAAPELQGHALHPALAERIRELERDSTGLTLLSVQPMRRHLGAHGEAVEHFGFRDGISQPRPFEPGADASRGATCEVTSRWDDAVRRGELLLGYPSDRDDNPYPAKRSRLLDNGCFLAVRKLSQDVGLLDEVLDAQARKLAPQGSDVPALKTALKESLMGRRLDGRPLADDAGATANNFNHGVDPRGMQCPFYAHVRRANPRPHGQPRGPDGRIAGVSPIPRILRRGMSYGPQNGPQEGAAADRDAERGMVFMAYAASLAEQFETIQRWIAGGNSSGVLSTHSDPFLGVPAPGASPRVFRHLDQDGKVVRIDLGDKPFTTLHWGLYLFVPSIDFVRHLDECVRDDQAARRPSAPAPSEGTRPRPRRGSAQPDLSLATWRSLLEDDSRRDDAWRHVRAAPGACLRTEYGVLLGSRRRVLDALRDDGRRYSVRGYGARFESSIGPGFLGLDPDSGHGEQSPAINVAIEVITAESAYRSTRLHARRVLDELRSRGQPNAGGEFEAPVDIGAFGETVLAGLCTEWFGLPDGQHMHTGPRAVDGETRPVRCPGHFMSVSRLVFQPHPSATVQRDGVQQGRAIHQSVRSFLADPDAKKGPVLLAIEAALASSQLSGAGQSDRTELLASTLAGVMLGFAPTVQGNFYSVMRAWIASRKLWDLQTALPLPAGSGAVALPYRRAASLLKEHLLAQMRAAPLPNVLWRTQVVDGGEKGGAAAGETATVVLGLGSAVRDTLGAGASPSAATRRRREAEANELLFGGARKGSGKTPHACPGREMAIGVLLGLVGGLLEAGSLRPSASPTTLLLVDARPAQGRTSS